MRAAVSVLRARRRSRRSRRCPGTKEAEERPVPELLLGDMKLCFQLLGRLVPGVSPHRAASRVEILQRVIDYILQLQVELEASRPDAEEMSGRLRVSAAFLNSCKAS